MRRTRLFLLSLPLFARVMSFPSLPYPSPLTLPSTVCQLHGRLPVRRNCACMKNNGGYRPPLSWGLNTFPTNYVSPGSKTGDGLKKMIYRIATSLPAVMVRCVKRSAGGKLRANPSLFFPSLSCAKREILQKEIELGIYSFARARVGSRKESYLGARDHEVGC